jgi:MoaA/NifB/PqqE/SkfB family radical SAM enzyme
MNIQTLKLNLEKNFELVCFYDLADATIQHGKIFKIFKKHYCPEYTPNQRLVFYTSFEPSQLVLDHLQRAATKIDVSNYFIIVCTPYNIKTQLQEANNKYGNSNVNIGWYPCVLASTNIIDSSNVYPFDTFCTLPFGVVSVNADGLTSPCCKYQGRTGFFDSGFDFNNRMHQIRNDIKNGQRHANCNVCWQTEDLGQTSTRQHFINKYIEQCDQEWVDHPGIRDLTINPVNLCNFKCRICDPLASSKIAVEQLKFSIDAKEQENLKKIIKRANQKNTPMIDQIFKIAEDLKFLHILGGEPFLWQELDQLLEKLIKTENAKHIELEFNTNGSIYPDHMIEKLLKFKSVEILISIDDIENRFELQRGGVWSEVLKNIVSFKNIKATNFSVKITPTVNVQNLLYLDKLVDFCDVHKFEIVWCYLENPQFLSINRVTNATKKLVYDKYINHRNLELQSIAKSMYQMPEPETGGNLFLDYMKKLDLRRGQNSSVVLKEIFDAMSS